MIYTIDAEVAREYGVNEAIMIASLKFWIAKNRANGTNYFEGRYWTYNSIKAFIELFPFWSTQNIKTILKHLKEKGVIISGNFNKNKYDQTLWYAFVDEEKWIGENKKFEKLELTNRKCGTNQPIPDIIPDILPDIKENNIINNITKEKEKKDDLSEQHKEDFEEFWKEYPKQRIGNKDKAFKSYLKALREKRGTVESILDAAKRYAKSSEVQRGFAKGCQAWLNDDRFNSVYEPEAETEAERKEREYNVWLEWLDSQVVDG